MEEQIQGNSQEEANSVEEPKTTDFEEKILEIEARYKKQIAGLDKKVSSLEKERESLQMEKLTDEERAKAEIERAKQEAELIKQETKKLTRERDLTKVLYDTGLNPDLFANRITGETYEDMKADADALKKAFEESVENGIKKEIEARLGGRVPTGGESSQKLSFDEQIKRAAEISSGRRRY